MTTKDEMKASSVETLADENEKRLRYALRQRHSEFVSDATKRMKFFFSEQWDPKVLASLEKLNRPALTINKIQPIITTKIGEYLAHRAQIRYVPAANGTTETAKALTKLHLDVAQNENYDRRELDLFTEGMITSRAYIDVRMDFSSNREGKICFSNPNCKNVIPDPDSDSYDPDDWNDVILISRQSIQDIEKNYGEEKVEAVKMRGRKISEISDLMHEPNETFGSDKDLPAVGDFEEGDKTNRRMYLVVERQFKSMETVDFFVNEETGQVARVPVDWDQDDIDAQLEENPDLVIEERRAQVIRWVVTCGSVVLYNKLSIYDHFTIVPFFPVFLRGKTSCDVELLIDPQQNYNKLRSQELHIVNGTSNSGWKFRSGSLKNMTKRELEQKGSMVGLVLEVEGDPNDVQRIDPVQIPQGLDRISSKADADLGEVSGVQDEARGVARADVAGKAITARRQALLTSMALPMENLAFTRKLVAKRMLKLFQKYYDNERMLYITGGGLHPEMEEVPINAYDAENDRFINDITEGDYNVVVSTSSARDTFDNQQFEELRQLAELGVPVPPALFVEHSTLARKEEIAAELRKQSGTDNPSEEERQMAMEERAVVLEEKKAGVMARKAQAMLSQARAQKVMQEIESGGLDQKSMQELILKAREIDELTRSNQESEAIRRGQTRLGELSELLSDDREWEKLLQARLSLQSREANPSGTSTGDDNSRSE